MKVALQEPIKGRGNGKKKTTLGVYEFDPEDPNSCIPIWKDIFKWLEMGKDIGKFTIKTLEVNDADK